MRKLGRSRTTQLLADDDDVVEEMIVAGFAPHTSAAIRQLVHEALVVRRAADEIREMVQSDESHPRP